MVLHPLIIGLLLLAALMHASWNAVLKSDHSDRLTTSGVITAMGMIAGLCVLPFLPPLDDRAWKYLFISAPIHGLYFAFLLNAYAHGDLSHIYPIARGLSPLLVMAAAHHLIGEIMRPQDVIGIALLSGGVVALALPQRGAPKGQAGHHYLATLLAIGAGVCIAAYIIVDGLGIRHAGPTFHHRLAYIAWLLIFGGPWLLALALWLRPRAVWKHLRQHWWRGVVGGITSNGSYAIAIFALALGPMSHVAALRETSVLFGAIIGAVFLHERFGAIRIAAAVVIVLGLVLMNGPTVFLGGSGRAL
jgi:drug/metabolite transporter (DMT)-like permease